MRKSKKKPETRRVKASPELMLLLEQQRRSFVEAFGREPRPGEPLFFEPDAIPPRPLSQSSVAECEAAIVEAMQAAGIARQFIHAFKRTGLLVSSENYDRLSPEDVRAWADALREFEELERSGH